MVIIFLPSFPLIHLLFPHLPTKFNPKDIKSIGKTEGIKQSTLQTAKTQHPQHKMTMKIEHNFTIISNQKLSKAINLLNMLDGFLWLISLMKFSILLKLVGSEGGRQPSDTEARAAIWEVCGDSGALQMLIDLLNTKVMDLEESASSEESDAELLRKPLVQK